jgi:anti-sigma B factor antagonist
MSPTAHSTAGFALHHWSGGSRAHVVAASGELDLQAAPDLRNLLMQLIELGHRELVLDLSHATFIDSTTIGVLTGRQRQLRGEDGELRIVCSNPDLLRTFDISGMTRVFRVHPTVSDALASIHQQP